MINNIGDIIALLNSVTETGFNEVNDSDLDEVLHVSIRVFKQINKYAKKHPMAIDCPDDYIYQSDNAQVDAIDLVLNICEELTDYSEYIDEDE